MALDWSQLCILSTTQCYSRQCGKMASGQEKAFSMLDDAPSHFQNDVRCYLDERLCNHLIGRGDRMEWPSRSPDLPPHPLTAADNATRAQDTDQRGLYKH
jgi:hypothetical protein